MNFKGWERERMLPELKRRPVAYVLQTRQTAVSPNRRTQWAGPVASTVKINKQNSEFYNDQLKERDNLGDLGVDR
jgi:hypothetical protein